MINKLKIWFQNLKMIIKLKKEHKIVKSKNLANRKLNQTKMMNNNKIILRIKFPI